MKACSRRGSVGELKQKHLLARNLRLVPGFCAAHRTQIRRLLAVSSWPRIESAKPAMRSLRQLRWRPVKAHVPPWRKMPSRLEEDAFQTHSAVSQAAAELLRLTHLPDDAPAHPALSLPSETLLVSLRVCKESLRQPHRQRQLALTGPWVCRALAVWTSARLLIAQLCGRRLEFWRPSALAPLLRGK